MDKIKVLNLFAGIGGNVANLDRDKYEITSIEYDRDICELYHRRFPNDIIVCEDAYDYLLQWYNKFDFIWASPPCQTHNRSRFSCHSKFEPYYPDLNLYKIIIFLQKYCNHDQKWCVENVFPYYEPLICPNYIVERHFIWCNFIINVRNKKSNANIESSNIKSLLLYHNIDDSIFDGLNLEFYKKRQILRNCCVSWFSDIIDNCYNKEKEEKYFQLSLDI